MLVWNYSPTVKPSFLWIYIYSYNISDPDIDVVISVDTHLDTRIYKFPDGMVFYFIYNNRKKMIFQTKNLGLSSLISIFQKWLKNILNLVIYSRLRW